MSIWNKPISLEILNATSKNTLIEHLNIIYTEVTENSISATMPVCHFTHQPLGMLHGGASVVLAETLGSVAANFSVGEDAYCVGLDINANHVRAMREGLVTGTAEYRCISGYRLKCGKLRSKMNKDDWFALAV